MPACEDSLLSSPAPAAQWDVRAFVFLVQVPQVLGSPRGGCFLKLVHAQSCMTATDLNAKEQGMQQNI